MEEQFDDIRPYYDSELQEAFEQLVKDQEFLSVVKQILPADVYEHLPEIFKSIKTQQEFQERIMKPILEDLLASRGSVLTGVGFDSNDKTPYLYVSNHRDIVTDSAFLDCLLLRNHMDTLQIALGDNLLARPWVRIVTRINKSFIVKRNFAPQDAMKVFSQLSSYIRHAITEMKSSVWIAQREGRAKDSNDVTQESILKMFAFSGTGTFIENLKPLNIRPTAISYEFDPCDYLKAMELQQKRDNPDFVKSKADDMRSMAIGIQGKKGRINYTCAPCINAELDKIAAQTSNRKEQVQRVKDLIDQNIYAGYIMYPINYVAYEALTGNNQFYDKITTEERMSAESYIESQLAKIDLPNADARYLRLIFLEMYANPLMNHYHIR